MADGELETEIENAEQGIKAMKEQLDEKARLFTAA
jgi:hypothetical protein